MKKISSTLILVLPFFFGVVAFAQPTHHEQFQKALSDGNLEQAKTFYQPGYENAPLTSRNVGGRFYGAGSTFKGRSPLYMSTVWGNSKPIVEFLLEKGARFSEVDPQHTAGRSVVFLCAQWPERHDWARFLLQKGLGTEEQFKQGFAVGLERQKKEQELAARVERMRRDWQQNPSPASQKCHRCSGSGSIGTATSYTNCPECNGSGRR